MEQAETITLAFVLLLIAYALIRLLVDHVLKPIDRDEKMIDDLSRRFDKVASETEIVLGNARAVNDKDKSDD